MQVMINYSKMPVKSDYILGHSPVARPVSSRQVQIKEQVAFKSKREIIIEGLYKNYSEQAKKVLETIKQDPTVMDFVNKYAKRISVIANKSDCNTISHVRIEYWHQYEGFWKKLKNVLSGNSGNVIDISGFGTDIYQATDDLCKRLRLGCLMGHVNMHLEKINELKEKAAIDMAKNSPKRADKIAMKQEQNNYSKVELRKTIADFFEK